MKKRVKMTIQILKFIFICIKYRLKKYSRDRTFYKLLLYIFKINNLEKIDRYLYYVFLSIRF